MFEYFLNTVFHIHENSHLPNTIKIATLATTYSSLSHFFFSRWNISVHLFQNNLFPFKWVRVI